VVRSGPAPWIGKLVAAISLALWIGTVASGLFIGFV
jgi:hypothetical protein